jgi:pimeloyl-ACP methyl ester carboxylesterase
MARRKKNAADYILPLNINGLQGRMLKAPAATKKQREILLVYGHHAMLERWWSLVENLTEYGNVTMPDLPGFGGMDSFNSIGVYPDLDAYADYLASFIKLRYRQKKVTIYAISFGFVVVTRMLQKYPELTKRVNMLVSVVGFMHHNDFVWSNRMKFFNKCTSRLFATRPISFLIRYLALNRPVIEFLTRVVPHSKHRFMEVTPEEFKATMNLEVELWQANDVRTHWLTTSQFFTLDNTTTHIDLPVIHVVSESDHYFNNLSVEQHMRQVFKDYKSFVAKSKAHTPQITANKKQAGVLLPLELRRMLNRKT